MYPYKTSRDPLGLKVCNLQLVVTVLSFLSSEHQPGVINLNFCTILCGANIILVMEKYLVYYSDAAVEVSENNIPSSSQILFCQTTSKSINVFLKKCWIYRVMISQKSREFRFISTEQHCQLFTFFLGAFRIFKVDMPHGPTIAYQKLIELILSLA